MNINDILPTEVVLGIFNYLEMHDLANASRVCKAWNTLGNDDSLWHAQASKFIHKVKIQNFCKEAKDKQLSLKVHLRNSLEQRIRTVFKHRELKIGVSFAWDNKRVFNDQILRELNSTSITLKTKCLRLKYYLDSPRTDQQFSKQPLLVLYSEALNRENIRTAAQMILNLGADPDVNVRNNDLISLNKAYPTPLFLACYRNFNEESAKGVQLLIDNGADTRIVNCNGQTAERIDSWYKM